MLIKDVAASLYDTALVPMSVHVAFIPRTSSSRGLSAGEVAQIIAQQNPTKFRVRKSHLRYFEHSILPPKQNWCQITLVPLSHPPPRQYESDFIQYRSGLPVVSVLPVAFDAISDIQTAPKLKKPKGKKLFQLLKALSVCKPIAIDDEFHGALLVHLNRIASFSPEWRGIVSKFVLFCQGEPTSIQATSEAVDMVAEGADVESISDSEDDDAEEDETEPSGPIDTRAPTVAERPLPASITPFPAVQPTVALVRPYIKKKRQDRQVVVSNATRAVVRLLQSRGINCVLHKRIAAFEYGIRNAPGEVELAILKGTGQHLSKDQIERSLLQEKPDLFAFRPSENGGTQRIFCYFDPTIAPPTKNHCEVVFTLIEIPLTSKYQTDRLVQLNGLLAVSLLPVVVDTLPVFLELSRQGRAAQKLLRQVVPMFFRRCSTSMEALLPIDEAYHREALSVFNETCNSIPDLAQHLKPFVDFCRKFMSSTDNIVPMPQETTQLSRSASTEQIISVAATNHPPLSVAEGLRTSIPISRSSVVAEAGSRFSRQRRKRKSQTAGAINRPQAACIIARRVVDILHSLGVGCALFGSLASHLYGNQRYPQDVDMLTFPPSESMMTQESLKEAIVANDSQFFLKDAKDPQATYRVLYFQVDEDFAPKRTFRSNRCKVDILIPGTMHLPALSPDMIQVRNTLPVIPYSLLLLHKVQAWDDHRKMTDEPHKYEKHTIDAKDVLNLLKSEHVVPLRQNRPWADRTLFSEEFYGLSRQRVREFYVAHPRSMQEFINLGF
ncbi:unnamed protein product [Cyclocybe aegerita]|uniref:Uncharacterized protein n=1 Tax=Cyclocybe aegerita TaxID=1973307 RepID=A0A8S0X0F9_CYCAE|nr:unnamed protein product [Cyclocybe aegerita]